MADEIRVTTVGGAEVHRRIGQNPEADGEDGAVVIEAADPADARRQIEATRARISGTIDDIEESILRKKGRIEEKLDVLSAVRERPVQILGAAFGAGLLLGLITGGGDEDDDEEEETKHRHRHHHHEDEQAEIWEGRARRLLKIAREQEEEIDHLRDGMRHRSRFAHRADAREDEEDADDGPSAVDRLRDFLTDHLTGLATDTVQRMVRRVARV
jgi:ElaB/YqjD/DUF883 family membrane-anchored ribosome-binding protein